MGIREWVLRPYFWWKQRRKRRRDEKITARVMQETGCDMGDIGGVDPEKVAIFVKKAGSQAIHQSIGKFMKHGRQSSLYRQTVKKHVSPEEPSD